MTSFTPDDDDSWDAPSTVRLYDNPSDLLKAESFESLSTDIDDEINALERSDGVDMASESLQESVLQETVDDSDEPTRDDIYGTSP